MLGQGFEASGSFVAERKATGEIVGVVCAGVRALTLYLKPCRGAVIFGLRVLPECRRQGVGAALLAKAEEAARGWGAHFSWLSVGRENALARKIFEQAGYTLASCRQALVQDGLVFKSPNKSPCEMLTGEDAREIMQSEFGDEDLFSTDGFKSLLGSPSFMCTVVCRNSSDDSVAVVSLWDTSKLKSLWVRRFVVPISWLRLLWSPPALVLVLAFVVASAIGCVGEYRAGRPVSSLLMLGALGVACCMLVVWRLGGSLRNLITSRGMQLKKLVLFAPFSEGPSGKQLLRQAVQAADAHGGALGFMSRIVILDARDENLGTFDQAGVDLVCLQKRLDGKGNTNGDDPKVKRARPPFWSIGTFYDPRDS